MSKIHVTAGIICRPPNILICQRHHTGKLPLKWEFPGGKVESGETPPACLQRELQEELGIEARIGPLVAEYDYHYVKIDLQVHLFFYRVNDFCGTPKNCVFEQIAWVEPTALPSFDFLEADVPIVRVLAAETLSV